MFFFYFLLLNNIFLLSWFLSFFPSSLSLSLCLSLSLSLCLCLSVSLSLSTTISFLNISPSLTFLTPSASQSLYFLFYISLWLLSQTFFLSRSDSLSLYLPLCLLHHFLKNIFFPSLFIFHPVFLQSPYFSFISLSTFIWLSLSLSASTFLPVTLSAHPPLSRRFFFSSLSLSLSTPLHLSYRIL